MSDEWEETRARLEAATTGRRIYQGTLDELAADIRAALQRVQEMEQELSLTTKMYMEETAVAQRAEAAEARVQELEAHWKDFMKWDESAVMYDWKLQAEAAEDKLARCVQELESNRSLRDTLQAALDAAKGE